MSNIVFFNKRFLFTPNYKIKVEVLNVDLNKDANLHLKYNGSNATLIPTFYGIRIGEKKINLTEKKKLEISNFIEAINGYFIDTDDFYFEVEEFSKPLLKFEKNKYTKLLNFKLLPGRYIDRIVYNCYYNNYTFLMVIDNTKRWICSLIFHKNFLEHEKCKSESFIRSYLDLS